MVSENLPAFLIGSLGICCLAVSLNADEVTTCKSPDGKFALRCVYGDKQPFNGDAAIVDVSAHKTVLNVDPNWTLGYVKLAWSPDSQRVAYFSEKGNDYATRVFFRRGDSFNEIALPELPSPKLPSNAALTESSTKTTTRIEPMQWLKSGELVLENELQNDAWGRAASKITIGFDQENRTSVRNVEQEKVSIVDYFLLLPAENFEAPPAAWLRHMRMGGFFQLCDPEPRKKDVDEKNGYMSCGGDGAQAAFEVALFRHRDGRPLLALCTGYLEGDNSAFLEFFEMGANGKMQKISQTILPLAEIKNDPEFGYEKDGWQFELPREGRTILVRALKSKRVLHKFTWTGEKFEEQK